MYDEKGNVWFTARIRPPANPDFCKQGSDQPSAKLFPLATSAGSPAAGVVGWLNTKMFEETGDEVKSQGWTAFILDTNGNGKRDEGYTEPDQPVDPTKDRRINAGFYGVAPSPVDNSVWGSCSAIRAR